MVGQVLGGGGRAGQMSGHSRPLPEAPRGAAAALRARPRWTATAVGVGALWLVVSSAAFQHTQLRSSPALGRHARSQCRRDEARGAALAARPAARLGAGVLQLRAKADGSEQGDARAGAEAPEADEIMAGIAQLQAGMAAIQAGLGKRASSAKDSVQSNIAASLTTVQDAVGAEVYLEKMERARDAVLQNIGIAELLVPEVEGPPFSLGTAVWLAGAAFHAYNDPKGGIVKSYNDGTKVSYSSSRALAQLHSGVLLIRLKSAELTAGGGVFGSDSARCDPYVTVEVNGAVAETKIVKNTLSPEFDEMLVMYAGAVEEDAVRFSIYDADLLMGNEELDYLTPDPLVGVAEIPLADIAAGDGWKSITVKMEQPPEPKTREDVENSDNPYWLKIPREAMVQTWPSLLAGGAVGGELSVEVQFLPLDAPAPAGAGAGAHETPAGASDLVAAEWKLLAESSADIDVDPDVFTRENLERLAFLDNEETDTQATVWRDSAQKRLVIAFRGTEQTRVKDFVTDALVAQCKFEPGCGLDEEIELPPLLKSATASLSKSVRDQGMNRGGGLSELVEAGGGKDGGALLEVGSLASFTQSITDVTSFTDMMRRVTGRDDYQFGDLSKEALQTLTGKDSYEFGDVSRAALKKLTGKDTYEFGDLTKTAMSAASEAASSYQFGDITKGVLSMFESSDTGSAPAPAATAAQEEALAEEGSAVHVGFLRGYLSVRERLVHMLRVLKEEEGGDSWTIFVTGHSLGGALATLCASDLAGLFVEDSVIMYNFGSPRVGNLAFVKRFNAAVPNAFRVVNDADVVARVPRSRLQNYFHVGRTVLVTNKPDRAVWVEGQSGGVDPLQERWSELSELIDAEVSLLQGLVSGDGVSDHMEDAYFVALRNALSDPDLDAPPSNLA